MQSPRLGVDGLTSCLKPVSLPGQVRISAGRLCNLPPGSLDTTIPVALGGTTHLHSVQSLRSAILQPIDGKNEGTQGTRIVKPPPSNRPTYARLDVIRAAELTLHKNRRIIRRQAIRKIQSTRIENVRDRDKIRYPFQRVLFRHHRARFEIQLSAAFRIPETL